MDRLSVFLSSDLIPLSPLRDGLGSGESITGRTSKSGFCVLQKEMPVPTNPSNEVDIVG